MMGYVRSLHATGRPHRAQQGAATLVVVMVLFFIISLVAAYTSRNLIFEQRTSANQYRSTQALEAADAGLEWAVSMLNFGLIDTACVGLTALPGTSFRQRYLELDKTSGKYLPLLDASGAPLTAACVNTLAGWTCSCPGATGAPALTPPDATKVWPAFLVRFSPAGAVGAATVPTQPGAVRIEVVGCTRADLTASASERCLSFDSRGALNEGRVFASTLVALTGNPAGLPTAALTARGSVDVGGAALGAHNTAPSGLGITIHAGGAITPAGLDLRTAPGTPATTSFIENDPSFTTSLVPITGTSPFTTAERMFATVFNMRPETYRTQQAAVQLTCPTSGCTAAAVKSAIDLNPGRPLWLSGDLIGDSTGSIGSVDEPVAIVVNGNLQFTTGGVTIHGLVYTRTSTWAVSGTGQVRGAVVAEGDVGVTGTPTGAPTIVYDADVLRTLRYFSGTFVRVPGSWKDYP